MKYKISLRKELLNKRLSLEKSIVRDLSIKINKKLIEYLDWQAIKSIHVYRTLNSKNEVKTDSLITFIQAKRPDIQLFLAPNKLSTDVPKAGEYDLVIVPLLGFDRTGHRLGYGGGYYDKFLAANHCKRTIGLAFSSQEEDRLPAEEHDKRLDMIITEKEIIQP